jgi:predicted enzyme related to lactoylglutathione lyase
MFHGLVIVRPGTHRAQANAHDRGVTTLVASAIAPQFENLGRFAIVSDPQGASVGLLKTTPR